MFFLNRSLSTNTLIELCRALRYSLSGGMMLRDAMDLLSREGTGGLRRAAAKLTEDLRAGWSLQESMDKQPGTFPPLFRALAAVGEETGNLPEVMGELERYYITQQKLRREFMKDISWPVIQFVAAVVIIAGLILILGIIQITPGRGGVPVDPLGLGLLGVDGAITFLGYIAGALLAAWILVILLQVLVRRVPWLQRQTFRIPVLGTCLRALALTRLCISLRLMLDTRMSVLKAIRLAFAATDNSAFIAAGPNVEASLRRGNTIADSIGQTRMFPEQLRSSIAVAEESGRLPEMCAVQAENYDDQARRSLSTLNKIASLLIWLVVAAFMITTIFSIFKNVYIKNLDRSFDPKTGAPTLEPNSILPVPPPAKR